VANNTKETKIAEMLGVQLFDLQQYIHRERIFNVSQSPRNLAFEIVKIKFVNVEYFRPTRNFFKIIGMTQRQWWAAFRGEKKLTEEQYKNIASHLGLTIEEAFNARQIEIPFDQFDK